MSSFWNSRAAIITGVAITLLGAIYVYPSATSGRLTMPKSSSTSSNNVPGLEFRLSQISRDPPSILVTLKNNSPDTPFTVLKWGTPLDSAALNTGVFKIADGESGTEIEQAVLKVNRKMPPSQEELVTLAPGTQEEVEVVFDRPWMPKQKPAKYKVRAEGSFMGVWSDYGDQLAADDLEDYGGSPFSGKSFATNEVVMEVH
jgi:hypothetical protein